MYNCEFEYGLRYGLYCVYWYADLCITHAMHHTHILSRHKKKNEIRYLGNLKSFCTK